jgi:hypothetical protein
MGAVRRVFGGLPGHVFKVLVTHHPLAMPSPADTLETAGRADATLNAADAVGVHLLLSGHYHRSSSGEAPAHVARKRSVLVVHAGTAVSTRSRGGEVNTYNLIHIEPQQCHLSIIVMAWAGEVGFAEVPCEAYVLQEEGWRAERGDGGRPFSPAR